jgi:hypothetical protein
MYHHVKRLSVVAVDARCSKRTSLAHSAVWSITAVVSPVAGSYIAIGDIPVPNGTEPLFIRAASTVADFPGTAQHAWLR